MRARLVRYDEDGLTAPWAGVNIEGYSPPFIAGCDIYLLPLGAPGLSEQIDRECARLEQPRDPLYTWGDCDGS